jgi:AraC family transcriptional regulator
MRLPRLAGGEFFGTLVRRNTVAGLGLSETRYAPGTRLPRHCHEHAYFCLVRRGSYREEYAGRERSCGPMTLAFHPPEEDHAEQFDGPEVRSFNVEVPRGWLARFESASPRLDRPAEFQGGPAVGAALRLFEEWDYRDSASPLIIEGLALQLLGLHTRAVREAAAGAPRWLRTVRDRLADSYLDPPSLTELAAAVAVHPNHLATAFRRHFGDTVGGFVRRRRVELACRLLTDTRTPLAEVALQTGFADQSHFTRTFRRLVGVTPAAYRRSRT